MKRGPWFSEEMQAEVKVGGSVGLAQVTRLIEEQIRWLNQARRSLSRGGDVILAQESLKEASELMSGIIDRARSLEGAV